MPCHATRRLSFSTWAVLIAAATAGSGTTSVAAPVTATTPGAKIQREVVGPIDGGVRYAVSPRGLALAAVEPVDGGQRVVIDGTAGPVFDEILEVAGPLAREINVSAVTRHVLFSDDGRHHGYAARSGDAFVVVKDGEELWRDAGHGIDRLAFVSGTATLCWRFDRQSEDGGRVASLVVDGTPGVFGRGMGDIALSGAGGRTAYTIQDPEGGDAQVVVVDGRVHHAGEGPRWTGDGSSILSQRAGTSRSDAVILLRDGEPVLESAGPPEIAVHEGSGSWAVGWRPVDGTHRRLMVNGSEHGEFSPAEIVWSPDGSRFAAVQRVVGDCTVMVDGAVGPSFSAISQPPIFSASGQRVAWVGRDQGRDVIVLDDELIDGHRTTGWIGFHGEQLAYRVLLEGGGHAVFRGDDGFGPIPRLGTVAFSHDGGRIALQHTPPGGMKDAPMIDGSIYGDLRVRGAFAFSPDGSSLAFVASTRRSDKERLLWVDGQATPLPRGATVVGPTWLDGMDMPVFATATRRSVGTALYTLHVDGSPTEHEWTDEHEGWRDLVTADAWWERGDDGRLRLLIPGPEGIERITVSSAVEGFATVPTDAP